MDDAVSGGRVDEKLEAVRDAVLRRNPGEPEFHQAVQEVLETLGPVVAKHPEFVRGKLLERICRARAPDHLPGSVDRRPRRSARQPRLPRGVQQRARALQGRAAVPPLREPRRS